LEAGAARIAASEPTAAQAIRTPASVSRFAPANDASSLPASSEPSGLVARPIALSASGVSAATASARSGAVQSHSTCATAVRWPEVHAPSSGTPLIASTTSSSAATGGTSFAAALGGRLGELLPADEPEHLVDVIAELVVDGRLGARRDDVEDDGCRAEDGTGECDQKRGVGEHRRSFRWARELSRPAWAPA
jgi:hypothetical protein